MILSILKSHQDLIMCPHGVSNVNLKLTSFRQGNYFHGLCYCIKQLILSVAVYHRVLMHFGNLRALKKK